MLCCMGSVLLHSLKIEIFKASGSAEGIQQKQASP